VVSLINQHRAGLGEGQLAISNALTASAVWKARHMANYNYFGHDDPAPPVARTAADRVATCGYPYGFGENIATGFATAQAAVNAWLSSSGHKANIENPSYLVTGVGVATASNGATYWVQDFGLVSDGGNPPPTTTAPPPPPPPTTTVVTTTPPPTTTAHTTTRVTTTGATTTTTSSPPGGGQGASAAPATIALKGVQLRVRSRRLVLATRVATGASPPVRAGVKCAARVGTHSLRVVVNAYRHAAVHCAWRLPSHVRKGAVATGFVRVRLGGLHARRSFRVPLSP